MLVIIVLVTPSWIPGTLASQFIYLEGFISTKKQRTKDFSNKNFQTKNQTKVDGECPHPPHRERERSKGIKRNVKSKHIAKDGRYLFV